MIFRCKKQAICHWKSLFNTASCFNWFVIVYKVHLNIKVSVCMFDTSKKIKSNFQLYNTANHYYINNSVKLDPSVRFNMSLSSNSSSERFHCPPLLWMLNKVIWIFVILIAARCELSDAEPETGEKDRIQPFTSSMKKREWETRPLHPIQCQRWWKGQHGLSEHCRHTIHNEWGHPASSVCVSAIQACGLHRNGPSHKGFKRSNTFFSTVNQLQKNKNGVRHSVLREQSEINHTLCFYSTGTGSLNYKKYRINDSLNENMRPRICGS